MCALARENLLRSFSTLFDHDEKTASAILAGEDRLDTLEDKLGSYLVPLGSKSTSAQDSRRGVPLRDSPPSRASSHGR